MRDFVSRLRYGYAAPTFHAVCFVDEFVELFKAKHQQPETLHSGTRNAVEICLYQ